jgi:hopanoid biosynthesis associated protein HpnK
MQVILNADDFGRSHSINAAVIRAHREGVLTSATLMVGGDSFDEAVALAHETPSLAVGLHVVVRGGRAVLPPERIPHLVSAGGFFPEGGVVTGFRYAADRAVRTELAAEMEAQFERFASTGLQLSHVDCHHHMHIHPTVFDLLVPLAERFGARGIRLPRDELWPALRFDRRDAGTKLLWAAIFSLLCRRCISRLRGRRLAFTDRVYGLMQTGRMSEAYVVETLASLDASTAELFFHPALERGQERLGPNPEDLAALLSPLVRRVIEERGIQLATYPTLARFDIR